MFSPLTGLLNSGMLLPPAPVRINLSVVKILVKCWCVPTAKVRPFSFHCQLPGRNGSVRAMEIKRRYCGQTG